MTEDDGPRLDGSGPGEERAPASGRVVRLLGSLGATALLLAFVFSLGSWGYKYRRWLFHQGRLQRILELRPSVEQVRMGLEAEGAQSLGRVMTVAELGPIAARWTPTMRDKVVTMGERAGQAQVFAVGEMVYFVFFDRDGKMTDFLVVAREP